MRKPWQNLYWLNWHKPNICEERYYAERKIFKHVSFGLYSLDQSLISEKQSLGIAVHLRNFLLHCMEMLLTNNAGDRLDVVSCTFYSPLKVTKKKKRQSRSDFTEDKNILHSPSVLIYTGYMSKIFQFPVIQTIFFHREILFACCSQYF